MFGNGSDGTLNVTSGTTNLNLNQKYQYTTVNVSSGATLSTSSTSGAVLYILATDSITIDGTINLSNIVDRGQNNWSVVIDGTTYTNPGTGNGGKGGDNQNGALGGVQGSGYGGGGAGGFRMNLNSTYYRGGHGGNGAATGSGGNGASYTTTSASAAGNGSDGVGFGGGGGAAVALWPANASGGKGGNILGANGSSASGSGTYAAGGGGGAGGQPGRPGIHIVLKAPSITINGTIVTSGTDGQFGGDGGLSVNNVGYPQISGSGGGGGGGGSAGNVYITTSSLSDISGTYTMARGLGYGGGLGFQPGVAGEPGIVGTKTVVILPIPEANFTYGSAREGVPVSFTDTSTNSPTSWYWEFGDGTTSTAQNPTKTYISMGSYTVTLTATNSFGSDSVSKTVSVLSAPKKPSRAVKVKSGSDYVLRPTKVWNGSTWTYRPTYTWDGTDWK